MNIQHLEFNVRKAIEALTTLQAEGFKIDDDETYKWKDKFFELKDSIDAHLVNAEELLADMRENGLTIATADAEGNWRSAKYLANCAEEIATRDEN